MSELINDIPSKQYHDFKGWSLTKNSTVADFATYDPTTKTCTIINPQTFSSERTVIILYAVFENHPYSVTFYNADGTSVIETTYSTYGEKAKVPKVLPVIDESGLELAKTYKFKGYSRTLISPAQATDYVIQQNVVNVEGINVTKDLEFYAVYKEQSVYDETTDLKYFDFGEPIEYHDSNSIIIPDENKNSSYDVARGYCIEIKEGYSLTGKITLPSYYNGLPIIKMGNTFTKSNARGESANITHIFWKQSESEPCMLRELDYNDNIGSAAMKLKYIELPEGLRVIDDRFFMSFASIETITPESAEYASEKNIIFPSTLAGIGESAFNRAFAENGLINLLKIPAATARLGKSAFANQLCTIGEIEIGNTRDHSELC